MRDQRSYTVLVADDIDESGLASMRDCPSISKIDKKVGLTEDQICDIVGDYDALMVRSATIVTAKILAAGKKLKIVARAGVGIDNIDVRAASDLGIYVVNSPQGNIIAAAEHTLALMMSLSRNIPAADKSVRDGKWERSKFVGTQLSDKQLGIVGLGQVGSHLAKVAHQMGMKIMAHDPYVTEMKAKALKCRVVDIDTLLKESDYVTLHVPKVAETKHLINAQKIALMKATARIVNTSRGGIVDEVALAEALKAGRLGGAALDVYEVEKAFQPENPLLNAPNLVLTPHLGASTAEAQINVAKDVAQQIVETFGGQLPTSAVNLPGLRATDLNDIRFLMNCGGELGRIAAQLLLGPLEDIKVTLEGTFAELDSNPILLAVANGAIGVHLAANVTFVNVRQVADKYKISLVADSDPDCPKGSMRIQLRSTKNTAVIRGTVTDDGRVLLKEFQAAPVYMILPDNTTDAEEGHNLFYSKHRDTPGMLGHITSILGKNGYNIANCHLGRHTEGGISWGICIFHTDELVSSNCIKEITSFTGVQEAKSLSM